MLGRVCINDGFYWGSEAGNYYDIWRGEGSRRAGAGLRFAEEWAAEEILDQVGSRLAAGRSHRRVTVRTARRRGPTFL